MRSNSLQHYLGITAFGESHGPMMGVVIEDVIPNVDFPLERIQQLLDQRRPSDALTSSSRRESDKVQVVSGVFEGKTTGMPICLLIPNNDARSADYNQLAEMFRPGHADYTYWNKFKIHDYRGGGRSSGRETVSRVAASGIVEQMLGDISITSRTLQIGEMHAGSVHGYTPNDYYWAEQSSLESLEEYLRRIREAGDSVGGMVEVRISSIPPGLGDPVFEKLDANLAKAVISVGGVKGIEFGDGFSLAGACGSSGNDLICHTGFLTNHAGGILGGISTGQDILFRYVVKPVPSIRKEQQTINRSNENRTLTLNGRFDSCLIPRIIPVCEAMVKLTLADAIAYQRLLRLEESTLENFRERLDKIDEDILLLLYRRLQITDQVSRWKQEQALPAMDLAREETIIQRLKAMAEQLEIPKDSIPELWKIIIEMGKRRC